MKKYLVVILIASLIFPLIYSKASAQEKEKGSITGQIKDSIHQPVTFATVTLLKSGDSTLVKGAITDNTGAYHFVNIPSGNYLISVSVIGMSKAYSKVFSLDTGHSKVKVPLITLQPNPQALKGVEVKASKPFIEHKPGQTIVNVENSPVSAGNTVMEVLEKSPGIFVDQDGNISLNGKGGVNVMINGRATHVSAKQLSTMLKIGR